MAFSLDKGKLRLKKLSDKAKATELASVGAALNPGNLATESLLDH